MKCAGATIPILLPKRNKKGGLVDANITLQVPKFRIMRVFSLVLLFYPVKQWDLFTHQTQLCSTWLFGKFEHSQLQSPTKVYSSAIIAAIKMHILLKNFSVWCFYQQHSHKQTQSVGRRNGNFGNGLLDWRKVQEEELILVENSPCAWPTHRESPHRDINNFNSNLTTAIT